MPRCPTCSRRLAAGAACPMDGGRAPFAAHQATAPPSIPGVEIEGLVGAGGFATVWAARDLATGAAVAVKLARAPAASAAARLDREATALARIKSHVPVPLGRGSTAGHPYLLTSLLLGEPLSHLLERSPSPPNLPTIASLADAILVSLSHVHAAGLVHADLSPGNILPEKCPAPEGTWHPGATHPGATYPGATYPGATYLVDLGMACEEGSVAERAGTVEYMAPEKVRGERIDRKADVYGFGCVLFEMITLRPPFVGGAVEVEQGHVAMRPMRAGELAAVPRALDEIVAACLAKDAGRRPGVEELREAIAAACRDAPRAAAAVAARRARSREPALVIVAEVRAPAVAIAARVAAHHGVLIECAQARVVAALTAAGGADLVADGLALARGLVADLGARVALHLTDVTVRERAGAAPIVGGADVEQPERWMPAGDWRGIVATAEAARALGRAPGPVEDTSEATPEPPFVGRSGALDEAIESLRIALASRTPTLVTIVGDAGTGKSRLAAEIAARFAGEVRVMCGRGDDPGLRLVTSAEPVAWIIDDVERAPDALLDAIEYATMDGVSRPMWIAACARPGIADRRPTWGDRAARHLSIELTGLDEPDAVRLAEWAVRSVEYVPRDGLRRLAAWAGGNPRALVEIVGALETAGVIRVDGGRPRLDAAALDALPRSPLEPWLAAQALAALPPPLADLARLVAVLDGRVTAEEIDAVQGDQPGRVDAGVGLWQLAGAGWLVREGDGWQIASAAHRAGAARLVEPEDRAVIHAAALAWWRARDPDDEPGLAALARHAAAAGDPALAARAHLRLGEIALADHRPVDADRELSRALAMGDDDELSIVALVGRGRARYRADRIGDALSDLRAARVRAEARGDPALAAEALLEEAIAHDWADDYAAAARAALDAEARVPAPSPRLAARLTLARGRAAWRDGRIDDAIDLLGDAARRALDARDAEAHTIAMVLLAPALVRAGRLDDAEARFADVIAACERSGDRLHLCAAHNNRMFLWSARRRLDRARADLAAARRLARELGHPMPERRATYNLAEDLHWSGDDAEHALTLARRCRALQLRHIPGPVADDALLLARILAARGDRDEPRALLAWLGAHVPRARRSATHRLHARMLALALTDSPAAAWRRLAADAARDLAGDEALEILDAWARCAVATGRPDAADALAAARPLLAAFPIWRRRFDALALHCGKNGPGVSGTSNPT